VPMNAHGSLLLLLLLGTSAAAGAQDARATILGGVPSGTASPEVLAKPAGPGRDERGALRAAARFLLFPAEQPRVMRPNGPVPEASPQATSSACDAAVSAEDVRPLALVGRA
jgi:hypothetical protein